MMIIDMEKMRKVLKSFYNLTGVRIGVFDEWHNELAAYPEQISGLCKYLRQDKNFDPECKKSDEAAFKTVSETQKEYCYRCHMNLNESIFPIVIEGKTEGFLMIGQFFTLSQGNDVREQIRNKFLNNALIREEIEKITVLSEDKLSSMAYIMGICAEYLCSSNIIHKKSTGLAKKAEEFIDSHLSEKLTVQMLADHFNVSKTSLYYAVKNQFGKSITEFMNWKKIKKAREMLENGNSKTEKIMEAINIADYNYFYRMFRKYSKMTLREFKKNL